MTQPAIDVEGNEAFWTGNTAAYQGEKNAQLLVFMTARYLGANVLDAGAGEGSLVRHIRANHRGCDVVGIDLAPKSADVLQGDLTNLDAHDATFDTIFCSEVIEHLTAQDTTRVLAELTRVLQPGGHLIVTTPYDEDLAQSQVTCPHCERGFHRWGHQQRFVEQDFHRLAETAGLTPLEIFPLRYSKIRRLRFLGPTLLRSAMLKHLMKNSPGKRNLLMVAGKQA